MCCRKIKYLLWILPVLLVGLMPVTGHSRANSDDPTYTASCIDLTLVIANVLDTQVGQNFLYDCLYWNLSLEGYGNFVLRDYYFDNTTLKEVNVHIKNNRKSGLDLKTKVFGVFKGDSDKLWASVSFNSDKSEIIVDLKPTHVYLKYSEASGEEKKGFGTEIVNNSTYEYDSLDHVYHLRVFLKDFVPGENTLVADGQYHGVLQKAGDQKDQGLQPAKNNHLTDGTITMYLPQIIIDQDGDGYSPPEDCDDTNSNINPGAPELCDGLDNNCNGEIDEGFDQDGDDVTTCGGDCNDADPSVYPGAPELCDGKDNDCDGTIDEDLPDGDGDGYTECAGDCDDTNPIVYPGATEGCDGVDNDCNGEIDDSQIDFDLDGFYQCQDCNDTNSNINPGAPEVCDGQDNDCDGATDEGFDNDLDGFTTCGGDCNDADSNTYPGAEEVLDERDNDCDNAIDECHLPDEPIELENGVLFEDPITGEIICLDRVPPTEGCEDALPEDPCFNADGDDGMCWYDPEIPESDLICAPIHPCDGALPGDVCDFNSNGILDSFCEPFGDNILICPPGFCDKGTQSDGSECCKRVGICECPPSTDPTIPTLPLCPQVEECPFILDNPTDSCPIYCPELRFNPDTNESSCHPADSDSCSGAVPGGDCDYDGDGTPDDGECVNDPSNPAGELICRFRDLICGPQHGLHDPCEVELDAGFFVSGTCESDATFPEGKVCVPITLPPPEDDFNLQACEDKSEGDDCLNTAPNGSLHNGSCRTHDQVLWCNRLLNLCPEGALPGDECFELDAGFFVSGTCESDATYPEGIVCVPITLPPTPNEYNLLSCAGKNEGDICNQQDDQYLHLAQCELINSSPGELSCTGDPIPPTPTVTSDDPSAPCLGKNFTNNCSPPENGVCWNNAAGETLRCITKWY